MPILPQDLVDRSEFDTFAARRRRRFKTAWMFVFAAGVASFFLIGKLWSYAVGLMVALVIPVASYDPLKRWNRASWLRQFPQLEDVSFSWRPDPHAASRQRLS